MKLLWSQDKFNKAFIIAANAHNGQKIPGSELPYIIHVALVCTELMAVISKQNNCDLIMQCAALHDTLEDTNLSYDFLLNEFGKDIANGVLSLSKNHNLEKTLQLEDSINRILKQPQDIWMIKMADRIVNLNEPPSFWTNDKKISYHKQSKSIYNAFKTSNFQLANRLKSKIEDYNVYIIGC